MAGFVEVHFAARPRRERAAQRLHVGERDAWVARSMDPEHGTATPSHRLERLGRVLQASVAVDGRIDGIRGIQQRQRAAHAEPDGSELA